MTILQASKLEDTYGTVVRCSLKVRPEFSAEWQNKNPDTANVRHPAVCGLVQRAIAVQHNKRLLVDAIRLVDQGHYHNDVRACLTKVLTAMGKTKAAEMASVLPDRLTWDTITEYALALLHLFISAELDSMNEWRCSICPSLEETP